MMRLGGIPTLVADSVTIGKQAGSEKMKRALLVLMFWQNSSAVEEGEDPATVPPTRTTACIATEYQTELGLIRMATSPSQRSKSLTSDVERSSA